jgi:hypothetical protein
MIDIVNHWTIKRLLLRIAPIVYNDFSFLLNSLSKWVDYCLDKQYYHTSAQGGEKQTMKNKRTIVQILLQP